MNVSDMIMMPVPISRYTDVCALLGGVSSAALSAGKPSPKPSPTGDGASQGTEQSSVENNGGSSGKRRVGWHWPRCDDRCIPF
jgi:hypothetical protein